MRRTSSAWPRGLEQFQVATKKRTRYRVPSNFCRLGSGGGLFPGALGRLGDEALLDGACRHTNVLHRAVLIDDFYALQIWVKLPSTDFHHC